MESEAPWLDGFGVETTVYRVWQDSVLLYAGHTGDLDMRLEAHRHQKVWYSRVTHVTAAVYECRTAAQVAERWIIYREQPIFNCKSKGRTPPRFPEPAPLRRVAVRTIGEGCA